MNLPITIAIIDLVLVTVLTAWRMDVRLVLLTGSIPLFAASGGLRVMLERLVAEMANAGTVVPICTAVGFAYVLRITQCDQHLVRLLLRPLQKVRWLLIPGGIAAGYLVNTTIVSQTGTAAVLGPILIPLLRGGGVHPVTTGAILLLGSSMGGELYNPGAVEMRKLAALTRLSGPEVVARSTPMNLLACGTALLSFWFLARFRPPRETGGEAATRTEPSGGSVDFRIHPLKAMVPVLPLFLLFADSALGTYSPLRGLEGPPKILAAMLIGVVLAGLTSYRVLGQLATAFFEGAGFAYTHVISLIVVASTFADGINRSGLIGVVVAALKGWPAIAIVVSLLAPWALAVVSGTGIAPAVSIMEFFVPVADSISLDPVQLGTVAAIGSHFGRTMSPAAAVVAMSAKLAYASPSSLIRRVSVPLAVGGAVLLAAALISFLWSAAGKGHERPPLPVQESSEKAFHSPASGSTVSLTNDRGPRSTSLVPVSPVILSGVKSPRTFRTATISQAVVGPFSAF
jgi:DcuC family C4-dicarboxylate transporter